MFGLRVLFSRPNPCYFDLERFAVCVRKLDLAQRLNSTTF